LAEESPRSARELCRDSETVADCLLTGLEFGDASSIEGPVFFTEGGMISKRKSVNLSKGTDGTSTHMGRKRIFLPACKGRKPRPKEGDP